MSGSHGHVDAAGAAPPSLARPIPPIGVALFAAPGYYVRTRADGVTVALEHSPYTLAKLRDGRFLAARTAREKADGTIEIGLSHTGASVDAELWVQVNAGNRVVHAQMARVLQWTSRDSQGPLLDVGAC